MRGDDKSLEKGIIIEGTLPGSIRKEEGQEEHR